MQNLIYRLSRENRIWSPERIRDTLLLLNYDPPCEDTIWKYMFKPRICRKRSTTWLPFLRNHLDVSWAIDFFTVTTINFTTLYVFLVLDHGRRKVVHVAITRHPFMNWVIQQLREAMPFGLQPKYLFRDMTASMAAEYEHFWTVAASRKFAWPIEVLGRIRSSKDSSEPCGVKCSIM
jgi:hypothetical protein